MLQGAIIFSIALPAIIACAYPAAENLSSFVYLGLIIWLVGFFFETVGDYQLDRFIKDPVHKGMLMDRGLWSVTRHPNYFGEATMWWGIWLIALPAVAPFGSWALFGSLIASPVLITLFLLKVSGVPMLEKAMEQRQGWQAYKARVSVFVPWFPKK
jgi:steroid 5-alpha reductase family enzyme